MKDIVAYTPVEAEKFGKILSQLNVSCIGPGTGIALLGIVESIDKSLEDPKLPNDSKDLLMGYRTRLTDICAIAAHQQKGVIDHFEKLVKGGG